MEDTVPVVSLRPRWDRRFATILSLSAAVIGSVALASWRYRLEPAGAEEHEERILQIRTMVQRQQEAANVTSAPVEAAAEVRHASPRAARYAVRPSDPAHLSRQQARENVSQRGVFAALGAPGGGLDQVESPFGGIGTVGDTFGERSLGTVVRGHGAGAGRGLTGNHGSGGGFGVVVPAETTPALDPNGRFATTYRPGRGHLSWFEAAIARGEIPEASRELLAEMAPSAAEGIAPSAAGALSMQWDLERSTLAPDGGPLRLRLALRSAPGASITRPMMSVHLVMDVSGSMTGDAIAHAREAAHTLVERLEAGDHFSLTTFDSEARVLVREGTVGARRAAILQAIDAIEPGGGTNISDGLSLGYQMAAHGPAATECNRVVMLLSDGEATDGETGREAIATMAARALQDGTETSSFGVGTSYDSALMSLVAEWGAGGYYYIPDSRRIATAFATELQDRAQPVAQAVEVRVRLADGVTLRQVYGSRRLSEAESLAVRNEEVSLDARTAARDHIQANRQHDREGGMRFFIPGFARNDQHVMLLGLSLPAGVGERAVASVELRYKDRILGRNVTIEQPVRARYGASAQESAASANPSVLRTAQSFDAGVTLSEAATLVAHGDRARAGALLAERVELLRTAATAMHAPELATQADRLARVGRLVETPASEARMLSMLLDASGRGMLR